MQNGIIPFHCSVPPSSVFAFFLEVVFRGQQISTKQLQSVTADCSCWIDGCREALARHKGPALLCLCSVQQLQGFTCPAGARGKGLLLPSGALRSLCCTLKAMDHVMALLTKTTKYVESLTLCRDSFLALDGYVLLCY